MVQDANFKNDNSYNNGSMVFPTNGSALGKFQAAMQIRRSSRLNCFNSLALGYYTDNWADSVFLVSSSGEDGSSD